MWRKRDKGEGPPIRYLHSKSLFSEFGPPPYHQQQTGLFRNTLIAPATKEHCRRVTKGPSPCQGSPATACNSRSRSLCGGKEIKARVCPPETSTVKAFGQSSAPSIPPAEDRAFPEYIDCSCNAKALPQGDKRTVPLSGFARNSM